MNEIRHVKIVLKDGHRAIEIPQDFDFLGDEATMRKEGNRLIVEPSSDDRDFFLWLRSREPLTGDDLPDERLVDPPPEKVEL
ncbi:AbrB/MazE/SpoVT family DNA-binding domain-containing protein [Rhizobium alvei]|uniref:AbrB/MazE/SpoVT family DNA-binding domain-containing protein n=1 Tax=Rhizobium alvei TaxID=1132659 RepID=A0ABT8YJC6_9HYPH|nr:AbrB/MazE/SpoVT family DNA-binding domain-containing protein [Rhizobium alvei]MDO6963621.1 AbrB/MazE/SpoVT family DNA-binding domain-containing protein [Rhizobium alvei]